MGFTVTLQTALKNKLRLAHLTTQYQKQFGVTSTRISGRTLLPVLASRELLSSLEIA